MKKTWDKIPQLNLENQTFFFNIIPNMKKITLKIIFTLETGFKIPEEQSGKVK